MLDELIEILINDDGAMIPRPATKKELKICQKDMKKMQFPSIPQGYADFLIKLNGFAWNGIEFFSTYRVTDPQTGFFILDIISANDDFIMFNEDCLNVEDYIQIGRSDEDIFVYNLQNGLYEVLDRTGRDVMEERETFEELFSSVVAPRM